MSKRQKPDQKQLFNSLGKDFHELVSNKQALHVDDSCDEDDSGENDIFTQHNLKKTQDCVCPICERAVVATRFAPHLASCMGMGRTCRSRNASRRVASNSKDRDNSSYGGIPSDDDDDDDDETGALEVEEKRKEIKMVAKKIEALQRKFLEPDPVESLNVDIEGDDDDLTNLRDILHLQDHSNSTSPADSASSSGSTKKKEKSKSKKSGKRDRTSPSSNISVE
ncbi:hypothetical protein NQ314_007407 [Rhamnusium bicolor]|uniref:SAGA-associated factor 11 n=1 Tax=Rhamnusium bicolor TaxID=1586634 RepID=A0AAV8YP13_9CUCU|nr:hypothetical protein NQ314_007407 [Rhamnusium bicolor]